MSTVQDKVSFFYFNFFNSIILLDISVIIDSIVHSVRQQDGRQRSPAVHAQQKRPKQLGNNLPFQSGAFFFVFFFQMYLL